MDLCITEQNVINKKNNNLENSKENKNEVKDSKLKSKLDGELNNVNKYLNVKLNPNEISIILFTSGTTSIAKAVALSQSNICADITSWVGNYYEMGQHGLPYKWKKFGQFVRFEGEKQ